MTDALNASAPQPAPRNRPNGAARVIAILTMALGAVIVLWIVISSAVGTAAAASVSTDTRTTGVAGVDRLDLELNGGSLRVQFANVTDAELEVSSRGGPEQWTFERQGDALRVASPESRWHGLWLFRGDGEAVLTLPDSLEGADAALRISAGDLLVTGDFGAVDLEVDAGRTNLQGSASALIADVNAGAADIDLAEVRTADLTVSAGTLDAALSGRQPDAVTIGVSAGDLSLTVPEGEYDVASTVSAGNLVNRLDSTPGAASTLSVDVSAGSVTVRSAGGR